MDGKTLRTLLLVVFVIDAIVLGILIGVFSSPWLGIGVGLLALAVPPLLIAAVLNVFGALVRWPALAREFPARTPSPDAKGRMVSSLGVRWRGALMNHGMEWKADNDYLHLACPISFMNAMPPVSIPWAAIEFDRPLTTRRGALVAVKAGAFRLWLPLAVVEREIEVRRAMQAVDSNPHEAAAATTAP